MSVFYSLIALMAPVWQADKAPMPDAMPAKAPVVAELFTSQSCSSCPAAEAYFREIAARDGVVALEWHVDYWNNLYHGAAGKWMDPFSSEENTERQRAYNMALRGRASVYTPQIVINGASETVGSRRADVARLLDNGKDKLKAVKASRAGDEVRFDLPPDADGKTLWLVTFSKSATTRVGGGENKGLTLEEAHIVQTANQLRRSDIRNGAIFAAAPKSGSGCALLIQDRKTQAMVGAAYCP